MTISVNVLRFPSQCSWDRLWIRATLTRKTITEDQFKLSNVTEQISWRATGLMKGLSNISKCLCDNFIILCHVSQLWLSLGGHSYLIWFMIRP